MIPQERYEPAKEKRYKSKYPHNLPPTATTIGLKTTSKPNLGNLNGDIIPEGGFHSNKGNGLTFGKPKGTMKPETTQFRKKGTGTIVIP